MKRLGRLWETAKYLAWVTRGSYTEAEVRAEVNRIRILWGRQPLA
jgi:hypothetical protein